MYNKYEFSKDQVNQDVILEGCELYRVRFVESTSVTINDEYLTVSTFSYKGLEFTVIDNEVADMLRNNKSVINKIYLFTAVKTTVVLDGEGEIVKDDFGDSISASTLYLIFGGIRTWDQEIAFVKKQVELELVLKVLNQIN